MIRFFLPTLFLGAVPLLALESHVVKDAVTVTWRSDGSTPFRLQAQWQSRLKGEAFDPVAARLIAPDGTVLERLERENDTALKWDYEVAEPQAGLYRLVWTGIHGLLDAKTEPALPEAFAAHAHGLELEPGSHRYHFVVPPGLDRLELLGANATLTLFDEKGERVRSSTPPLTVPTAGKAGRLWSLEINAEPRARLTFAGAAPLLMASTPEAAQAVGHGVTVLPGGVLCFHPWQMKAWKLLESYRQLPREAFDVPLPDLETLAKEWEAEPARNLQLFGAGGSYSNLKPILAAQNLDAGSPWFGSINVWREFDGTARTTAPVFFYRREEAFGADFRSGSSQRVRRARGGIGVHQSREASHLAAVYGLNQPFNPLYRNEALLRRVTIALLADLMMIRPSEMVEPVNNGYYGGNRAFHFARMTKTYSLIGPHLPKAEQRVIGSAMEALADRHLVGRVGLVTNQWLSIPKGIHQVYLGSGEKRYLDWTHRHLRWMTHGAPAGDDIQNDREAGGGFQPAGYATEAGGPDATYNGITLAEFAQLTRELDDPPELVETLRRSYFFFNHTIVPHPTEQWTRGFGSSDFSHRTPGNWWASQSGGGILFASDLMPEAGVRAGLGWFVHPQAPDALERFRYQYRYNPEEFFDLPEGGASRIGGTRYKAWHYFPRAPKAGRLPAQERKPFFRNFGNEFFAIRRGSYYALVYAGNTRPEWMRARVKDDIRYQDAQNGGGISLLWSDDLGPSLIGTNLGSWGAHSLIARKGDREYRNDYWQTRVEQVGDWSLSVSGAFAGLPIRYQRDYRFEPEAIEVTLTLVASEAVTLDAFDEALPLVDEEGFQVRAIVGDRVLTEQPIDAVSRLDLQNRLKPGVHGIALEPPRRADLREVSGTTYRNAKRKFQTIALGLPLELKAGEPIVRKMRFTFDSKESAAAQAKSSP